MSSGWSCPAHGKQDAAFVFADALFCTACVRDALLKLGLVPLAAQSDPNPSEPPIKFRQGHKDVTDTLDIS